MEQTQTVETPKEINRTQENTFLSFIHRFYNNHRRSFSRATLTSFAATVVDFTTLYCLVEFAGLFYVIATACGACAGAITNFLLNRHWAFESKEKSITAQGFHYAIVSFGSLLLNTGLVFCFTEFGHLSYLTSKVIASLSVGWGWNYPLHRYFVFSKPEKIKDIL